jgi:hypothetical protein
LQANAMQPMLATTMSDPNEEASSRALADLDAVIANLEETRAAARRRQAGVHGTEAEALAVALKGLDEKLSEARGAREKIAARTARTARMRALTAELQALMPEVARLSASGDQGERFQALRARALALKAEADELRGRKAPGDG